MDTFKYDTSLPRITDIQWDYLRFLRVVDKEGLINTDRKSVNGLHDYTGLSRCWTHTTVASSSGYGQIMINGKHWNTHTYSYWIHNGKPDMSNRKLHVGHICDNPPCCNPEHLTYGTAKQNALEAVQRIRTIQPAKVPIRATVACNACRADTHHKCEGYPCTQCVKNKIECVKQEWKPHSGTFVAGTGAGEDNVKAILTVENVLEIRRRQMRDLKYGELKKMVEEFPVKYGTLQGIAGGRLWTKPEHFPPGYFEKFPDHPCKPTTP